MELDAHPSLIGQILEAAGLEIDAALFDASLHLI